MYRLLPAQGVGQEILDLPTGMYRLPPMHGELEAVQDADAADENALDELVVQCSPSDPPYSLLCILEDLRKNAPSLRLETSCHLHSSLTSGTSQDELLDFLSQHTEGGEEGRCLRLRIIWRKMCCRELQLSVGDGTTMRGESSLARLLARRYPDVLSYDEDSCNSRSSHLSDEWMDRACSVLQHGNEGEEAADKFVADLDLALAGSSREDLAGLGRLGVADYVVWSALTKSGVDIAGSSNVARWSELCSRLCSSRIELSGKDESVVVGDQMSQSPPQPSCRQEEDVSPSAPPPDFDTLFPGPLLPDDVQDKNDGVVDYSSIPDEDFELKSNNPRPWPSIDSVSSEGRYLLDLMRRPAFASEKLDGSNVSVSSRGLVCSRRCVIAKRPLTVKDLASTRFVSVTLEGLWDSLRRLPALEEDLLRMTGLAEGSVVAVLFGELVVEGTATSKEDKFDYKRRGFQAGAFYAFGLSLCLDKDVEFAQVEAAKWKLEDEGGFELVSLAKNDSEGNRINLRLDQRLANLFFQHGIPTLQTKRYETLEELLSDYSRHLSKKDSVEGVVINVKGGRDGGQLRALKWKGFEESYNGQRIKEVQKAVKVLREVGFAGAASALLSVAECCPRYNILAGLSRRLEEAYLSARSKFPLVTDDAEAERDKKDMRLIKSYAGKISAEMVEADGKEGDEEQDERFAKECPAFALLAARRELMEWRKERKQKLEEEECN